MSMIALPFTDEWTVLDEVTLAAVADPDFDMDESLRQEITDELLEFARLLAAVGVCGFASLVLPVSDEEPPITAWCGITDVMPEDRQVLPEHDWETKPVVAGVHGDILKQHARFLHHGLSDAQGTPVEAMSFRYVFPGDAASAVVQFESISLGYEPELEEMFDVMASQTVVFAPQTSAPTV